MVRKGGYRTILQLWAARLYMDEIEPKLTNSTTCINEQWEYSSAVALSEAIDELRIDYAARGADANWPLRDKAETIITATASD
jgi:hypothetical protein